MVLQSSWWKSMSSDFSDGSVLIRISWNILHVGIFESFCCKVFQTGMLLFRVNWAGVEISFIYYSLHSSSLLKFCSPNLSSRQQRLNHTVSLVSQLVVHPALYPCLVQCPSLLGVTFGDLGMLMTHTSNHLACLICYYINCTLHMLNSLLFYVFYSGFDFFVYFFVDTLAQPLFSAALILLRFLTSTFWLGCVPPVPPL